MVVVGLLDFLRGGCCCCGGGGGGGWCFFSEKKKEASWGLLPEQLASLWT